MMLRFHAIIMDMDGTLTRPTLDFRRIRVEIGLPPGDLAVEIARLPAAEQARAWRIIEAHETEAKRRQELQPGCVELLAACRRTGIKVGILTRNTRASVDHLCERFSLCFDAAVTREFPQIKPHPGPVLHMLELWGIAPSAALMVGDYVHDIECGRAAGTATCFFQNLGQPDFGDGADYRASSMSELHDILFGPRFTAEAEKLRAVRTGHHLQKGMQ